MHRRSVQDLLTRDVAVPVQPPRRAGRVAVAGIPAVAAAVAGGLGLTRNGLAESEAATFYAAHLREHGFVHLVSHLDLVHATYYASMHLLVLLGGGIVALRSVSLVATVLAAALIGVVGRRLTGSATSGVLAGLVFALCPTVDGFAKLARSYGVLPLLVTATVAAFLWGIRSNPRRTSWLAYFAALLVTVYVHELSLLLLPALAVVLLLQRVDRRVWRQWALTSASVVVLALPLLYLSHREDSAVAWIGSPGWRGFAVVARTYCGPSPIAMIVFAIGALAAVVAGVRGRRVASASMPGDRRLLTVALPVAVVPPTLLIVESVVGLPLFDVRYVSYYIPAVALLVGHGLAQLGHGLTALIGHALHRTLSRRSLSVGTTVLGLAGVATALIAQLPLEAQLTTPLGYRGDYGAVYEQIEANARLSDAIAYLPGNLRYVPDGYPRLRRLDDFALRVSPTRAGNFRGTPQPIGIVTGRMASLDRIWAVSSPRSFLSFQERSENAVLRRDFLAVRRWHDHGLDVTLWVRAGATPRATRAPGHT